MWLETDVNAWKDKINQVVRSFAFADWFPKEGRVYLPFQSAAKGVDDDINLHFNKDHKYQIHDYAKGLLKDSQGRIVRIGKIINRDEQEEAKRIQGLYDQKKLSDIKYRREMEANRRYFRELRAAFEASPFRRGVNKQSPYMVVISSTAEDLAGMSTNRDWTSCMDLGGGSNRESIWCELKDGGFVAYLCYSDDVNIDKPLARLHIRRFDNKRGDSIALPEDSVYGNEIQGFKEAVQAWLDSKQGKIRPGRYIRRGGWYSDTFGSAEPDASRREKRDSMRHTILPVTGKGLFKLLDRQPGMNSMSLRIVGKLLDPGLSLTDDLKKKLEALIRKDYPHKLPDLLEKYPDLLTPEDYKGASYYGRTKMLKAKKDDPRYAELHKELVTQSVMSLDINDPKLKINKKGIGQSEASIEIADILRPLADMGRLPEPLIRKVVRFAEQMMDRYGSEMSQPVRHTYVNPGLNAISTIIHAFHMTGADTPTVLNFYKKVLPYWDNLGAEHGLGIALGRLGENGKSFLPFLRDKEQQTSDVLQKERLLYIIDSIENGTGRSDKYNFF